MAQGRETVGRRLRWLNLVARIGHVGKGVVYIVMGIAALLVTLLGVGEPTGSRGAMKILRDEPFGEMMVAAVAVGLGCYSAWRWIQLFRDPTVRSRNRLKRFGLRMNFFISAAAHTALAVTAVTLVLGLPGIDDDDAQEWAATLLAQPAGFVLVFLVGVGFVGAAIGEMVNALRGGYRKRLDLERLGRKRRGALNTTAVWGLVSRGVVFAIIGVLFMIAAVTYDPQRAGTVPEALMLLHRQMYGPWLMGVIAAGLLCYGLLQLVIAGYRRVEG